MLPGNERHDVERGGKIIMPPSALDQLTRLNIVYPMLFKLTNRKSERITHCGVLEFVADEGKVYLPYWMMKYNLLLDEGESIQIESVSLPVATFSRFQPQSEDFLDITNPKAVLENGLRNFACLSTGDVIAIKYNQRVYEMCVLETKPGPAVSIIECDMNVEFAPPVGYKEPKPIKKSEEEPNQEDLSLDPLEFVAFKGEGNRLDGKKKKDVLHPKPTMLKGGVPRVIPDYNYKVGTVRFLRNTKAPLKENKEPIEEFKAFKGEGFSLRDKKSDKGN
ncbi:unnamed protein product [Timema podura]|uniref:Ubiquitin fusion degradaton protein n=1 Tax=Timema podura TaxID=61482 RepID=A0ABN7PDU9_TIMPD|nr:unnamed protein product [Timema podura]